MRNMAFSLTVPQMQARTKTVTRRLGWSFLKAGDVVMAVEKSQGLKRGEKVKRLYPIEIIGKRAEPLYAITPAEIEREGFAGMSVNAFVRMFCQTHTGCKPATLVNRIEFREYEPPHIPLKKATVSGPTPPNVLRAISEIREYLKAGNFEQAIISRNGGAAFRLTDIYEDVLGRNVVASIKHAGKRAARGKE